MDAYKRVASALKAKFPKPRVDSEWLEQCCAWIAQEKELSVTENFQEFFQHVHDQLLNSDLKDSMHHGTGLPELSGFTGDLLGPPVLVQILAIKEIGVSAFQQEQIRAAREERMLAGVGDQEGEEDGDVEVEGEGPMPKYPRATLLLRLSDGSTEFEGMEYRPIPQVVLGATKLGYKMQLKGTHFSNGIAFLEPATIELIGGENTDLHAEWEGNFKQYLQARLSGQGSEILGEVQSTPMPNFPRASRVPLRDISPRPPTLHDDDVDMEPRRKRPSNTSRADQNVSTPSNPRSIKPLPVRLRKSGEISESHHLKTAPDSTVLPKPELVTSGQDRRGSFDFDLLADVGDENVLLRPSHDKGKGRAVDSHKRRAPGGYSSDYGIDEENLFADDNFWEALDRVEKEALEDEERPDTQPKSKPDDSGDENSQRPNTSISTPSLLGAKDVIELYNDSDEEANKENAFVPMRHVRRRTEDLSRGRSPTTSQATRQLSSQRKKKAGVIDTSDVIDISDSD